MDEDVVSGAGRPRRTRLLRFFRDRVPTRPDAREERPSAKAIESSPADHATVGPAGEQVLHGHTNWVHSATFSPDGRLLATCSGDMTVRIWDLATGTTRHVLTEHRSSVHVVRFAPCGDLLASGDMDSVRLWDVTSGHCVRVLDHADALGLGVCTAAFSPDGRRLATSDGRVLVWDLHSDRAPEPLTHSTTDGWAVAYSRDGRYLAAVTASIAVIWDAATHERLREMSRPGKAGPLAFNPSGTLLATASARRTWAWDVATGEECTQFTGIHRDDVTDLAFSPDGQTLATAGWDSQVGLWDPTTGAALGRLTGLSQPFVSVEYSPDGRLLAAAGWDGLIRVWNTPAPLLNEADG
ncbi:WD40 repeat domain-containing protein [Streptomyces sp. NPDC054842]